MSIFISTTTTTEVERPTYRAADGHFCFTVGCKQKNLASARRIALDGDTGRHALDFHDRAPVVTMVQHQRVTALGRLFGVTLPLTAPAGDTSRLAHQYQDVTGAPTA